MKGAAVPFLHSTMNTDRQIASGAWHWIKRRAQLFAHLTIGDNSAGRLACLYACLLIHPNAAWSQNETPVSSESSNAPKASLKKDETSVLKGSVDAPRPSHEDFDPTQNPAPGVKKSNVHTPPENIAKRQSPSTASTPRGRQLQPGNPPMRTGGPSDLLSWPNLLVPSSPNTPDSREFPYVPDLPSRPQQPTAPTEPPPTTPNQQPRLNPKPETTPPVEPSKPVQASPGRPSTEPPTTHQPPPNKTEDKPSAKSKADVRLGLGKPESDPRKPFELFEGRARVKTTIRGYLPGHIEKQDITYEVVDGRAIFEGDIDLGRASSVRSRLARPVLSSAAMEEWKKTSRPKGRMAVRVGGQYFWPKNRIPYRIDMRSFGRNAKTARKMVRRAVAHLNRYTNLKLTAKEK